MTDEDEVDSLFRQAAERHRAGRIPDALRLYEDALRIAPQSAAAHNNRGVMLYLLRRYEDAFRSFIDAIRLAPRYAEAYGNNGEVLRILGRFQDALLCCDHAIALKPDYVVAHNNKGKVLHELNRFEEAFQSFRRASELAPAFAEAHYNSGNASIGLGRTDDAIRCYDRAIACKPDYAEAYYNRGFAAKTLGQWEEAIANYEMALTLVPDMPFALGDLLFARMQICDFGRAAQLKEKLLQNVERDTTACNPFQMLAISGSLVHQRKAAETFVRTRYPSRSDVTPIAKSADCGKIRLGYFSADFHNHATMQWVAELFELHDRSRFELMAFSFGPNVEDEMRRRAVAAFDLFMDVGPLSDRDIALLSREKMVDIAIDLKGFTENARPGIFACRAAPVQIGYIGFPGTMGADYIDYLIADETLIPQNRRHHYRENIVYMPNSYQANDRKRPVSDRKFTRAELGLPENGIVFCCFNNSFKIELSTFESWMRILRRVDGSVLWLLGTNRWAMDNLRKEAGARGVDPARIVFGERLELSEHLARLSAADLFLDTLPYNAHTTASEMLWAGVPVLTCMGESFAARVAASVLQAVGLPELVTSSPDEYETLAVALAMRPDRLAAIRQTLAGNRFSKSLFDTGLFARHFEAALTAICERHRAGLSPADIRVTDLPGVV